MYKPSRISLSSTNRRSNSARRKTIFYPSLIAQQASVLLSPSFKFFTTDTQDPLLLSNTQYTLPTITFIPISNITTSALLFSSLEIIPTPQSYPPLVLLCSLSSPLPPLFLILSPSDSRPIFRISQIRAEKTATTYLKTNVSVYSKRESSDDERFIYNERGGARAENVLAFSKFPADGGELVNEPLVQIFHRHARDPRKIRTKIPPSLLDWRERNNATGGGVRLYLISREIII